MPPAGQKRVLFIRARREEPLCLVWQLEIKLESKFPCEKTQRDVTTTEAECLRILESWKSGVNRAQAERQEGARSFNQGVRRREKEEGTTAGTEMHWSQGLILLRVAFLSTSLKALKCR